MRILHVAPSFARRDGGPSETLRGLLPALKNQGVDISVVTTDKGLEPSDQDFLDSHVVKVARSLRPKSWTFAPDMVRLLREAMVGIDLVHIHSIHTFPSTVAMRESLRRNVPYVLEPHGALDKYHIRQGALKKRSYSGSIDRRGLRRLSGAIYSSERERQQAAGYLPRIPTFLMPLGVDSRLFSTPRTSPNEKAPSILFLGRVTQKKRIDLLIRALSEPELQAAGAVLTVGGPIDPKLSFSPAELARELGVAHRVNFLGQVDSERRLELLASASIFALPSEDESFGVAVAEALAAGCPTVVSEEIGIAREVSAVNGLRIAELRPRAFAIAIHDLISDRFASDRLGELGRKHAAEHFTWTHAAEEAISAYEAVLGGLAQ